MYQHVATTQGAGKGRRRPDGALLSPTQRMAWRSLAIEVYRAHDKLFSSSDCSRQAFTMALRRLRAALPSLREMMHDSLLERADREYVEDLVRRLERWSP